MILFSKIFGSRIKFGTYYLTTLFAILTVLTSSCSDGINNSSISNQSKLELVSIPGGTFTMGSPITDEGRGSELEHIVTLSSFRMTKYEITNAQYAEFLNAKSIGNNALFNAGAFPTQPLIYKFSWGLNYINGKWQPETNYENYPVVNVTWYGAKEYANYIGGFLPTEAQWEYACRGGTTTPFNTGSCLTDTQANYDWFFALSTCKNKKTIYPAKTMAVGSYLSNAFGLFDMHGNVSEWCSDWYQRYSDISQINPIGADTGVRRLVRGGSFSSDAVGCRSASRGASFPDSHSSDSGFRIVFAP